MSQRMSTASKTWKSQGADSLLEPPEGIGPANTWMVAYKTDCELLASRTQRDTFLLFEITKCGNLLQQQ